MSDYQKPEPSEDELRLGYFQRNSPWVKPGNHTYNTPLKGDDELAFRRWVDRGKVPFDPDAKVTDYDMRGFWKALQENDQRAVSAIDPNDKQTHYPDYWKTPYHQTFSAESQWANHRAPNWTKDDKLVTPDGKVIFDDRAKPDGIAFSLPGAEIEPTVTDFRSRLPPASAKIDPRMVVQPYADPGYAMPNPYVGNLNQAPGQEVGGYLSAKDRQRVSR